MQSCMHGNTKNMALKARSVYPRERQVPSLLDMEGVQVCSRITLSGWRPTRHTLKDGMQVKMIVKGWINMYLVWSCWLWLIQVQIGE